MKIQNGKLDIAAANESRKDDEDNGVVDNLVTMRYEGVISAMMAM